jgi:hypothetical protein
MQRLQYPFPLFLDQRGALLDAGQVFVGAANADPELSPITVYWDAALTVPAAQPLQTRGGVIVNDGAPAVAYISATDYSMRVRDADSNQVSYAATATDITAAAYQPLADALTALSATDPTTIGLAMLGAADATAVKTLLGLGAYLALTGGTVSGAILRQSAGAHLYHNDTALTAGGIFLTATGASDPTTLPGQIWAKY